MNRFYLVSSNPSTNLTTGEGRESVQSKPELSENSDLSFADTVSTLAKH